MLCHESTSTIILLADLESMSRVQSISILFWDLNFPGVRQWPINLCTSSKIIHKITTSIDYNQWLNTQLNEQTNKNSIKSPKLLSQRIRKRFYRTLRTSVIINPMSPPSLEFSLKKKLITSIAPRFSKNVFEFVISLKLFGFTAVHGKILLVTNIAKNP